MAFSPIFFANKARIEPGAAFDGSVAPINVRKSSTALALSKTAATRNAVAALAAKAAIELGTIKDGWNGFSVLQTAASRVGALDIGFVPGEGGLRAAHMAKAGALDVLFLLGADAGAVAGMTVK